MANSHMILRFNDFELNLDTCLLSGPDGAIHMEPQVFDCLVHLAVNRDRVVSKTELLDEVWGSRYVSESALTTRIKAIRRAVGDSGRVQHTIRTAHGKGYQFVAPLTEAQSIQAGSRPTDSGGHAGSNATLRRIPATTNRFRGREHELNELQSKLTEERLVTILGPGGTGKTRLSVELAHAVPDDQSVVFVNLAAVRDERALGQALAAALAVDAGLETDVVSACCSYLRIQPMLVILDNCEHVPQSAAELVSRLLTDSPTTVVATSRVPLRLRDESIFRLSPLPVLVSTEGLTPEAGVENAAVALFVDRAQKVEHGFVLDDTSLDGVVSLCSALDGLPLALELAAGRLDAFSIDDLVARLDRRLDLLGDDNADAVDRHRSLRATLDWSYELLDQDCQRLFRHLAVFPAGLTLDAVEWLGERLDLEAEFLPALNGLVAASLVNRVDRPSGTRYVQLETMRAFGLDQLTTGGEVSAAMDLAAEWTFALLDDLAITMASDREVEWNDRIRREIPNIREARLHLLEVGRITDLVKVSTSLDESATLRDVSEIWTWCDELLGLNQLSAIDLARARAAGAKAAWRRGRIPQTIELANAVIADSDDPWALEHAYSSLGVGRLFTGEWDEALEALTAFEKPGGYHIDLANIAVVHAYAGDVDTARTEAQGLRDQAEADNWPTALAWSEYVTGEIEAIAGSPTAVGWLEAAVERAESHGGTFTVGVARVTLASQAAASGDVAEAARRYADLIDHWLRSGTWTQLWTTLRNAAIVLADPAPAMALLILDAAMIDPYAPGLNEEAEAEAASLRATLLDALSSEDATQATSDAQRIDRETVAVQVRSALRSLLEGATAT